jgi:hypothetical protein
LWPEGTDASLFAFAPQQNMKRLDELEVVRPNADNFVHTRRFSGYLASMVALPVLNIPSL